ncbi:lipase [Chlamydoabsidia padenii]|nr:lipase [Chlamydoabsidia padenii]
MDCFIKFTLGCEWRPYQTIFSSGKGWYVNVPDHEGPYAYFLVGPNAGHCVLDSIRAVLNSGKNNLTKLHLDAKIQLWGYSGGAHATGWATQLQASYAPDLHITGAAFGGTLVDIDSLVRYNNGKLNSGFNFAGFIALGRQYPLFGKYLDQAILPEKKQKFKDAANYCVDTLLTEYPHQDIQSYSNQDDFLNNPVFNRVMNESRMGRTGPPKFPVFMYHAEQDEAVPYKPALKLYVDWCSTVADIEFVSHKLLDHGTLALVGIKDVMKFLQDGFQGVPRRRGCHLRTL